MKKFAVLGILFSVMIASSNAFAADAVIAPAKNDNAVAVPTGPEAADHTDRPSSFGHAGQIMVSATTTANIGGTFSSNRNQFNLNISPEAAYFITDMVFVGGVFNISYLNTADNGFTTFDIGPKVGLHFPIGNSISALPTLGLLLGVIGESFPGGGSSTSTTFNINLDGTFAWHVVPHFSFIFGPYFHQMVGDITASTIGINLGILGWI